MNDGGGGGGAGGEGKDLQVEGLALITEGINLAMSELRELGMVGEASVGRGFADLALSGLELGHGGLTSALDTFCERWEWGVRALILEGSNTPGGPLEDAGRRGRTVDSSPRIPQRS